MYLNFYQLKCEPFHITPDPAFLFLSGSHKEALASLIYGIEKRKGFVAVTGEVGTGKTTITRAYLELRRKDTATGEEIARICSAMPPERASSSTTETDRPSVRPRLIPIYLFNSAVEFDELLRTVLRALHIGAGNMTVAEMVERLHWALIAAFREGHIVALFIDEAQNMPLATLEHLRMLSNLETHTQKLLQIVLVGQPELDEQLEKHNLRQLKQRIAMRVHIARLTRKESQEYIGHRLGKAALMPGHVFSEKALRYIVRKAKGCPRTLNIICDNVLIAGYGSREKPISRGLASRVVADLALLRPSRFRTWRAVASGLVLILVLALGVAVVLVSSQPAKNPTLRVPAIAGDAARAPIEFGTPTATARQSYDSNAMGSFSLTRQAAPQHLENESEPVDASLTGGTVQREQAWSDTEVHNDD